MVFKSRAFIEGSGGVTTIDGITGAVTLVAGSNITITDNSPTAGSITIAASGGSGTVLSVTGLNTDNTDPTNPVVQISVDGTTITGAGTPGSPLVAAGGGGGAPGGTDGAVQFNKAGVFGGDTSFIKADYGNRFLGVQQAAPEAPVHATGAYGQSVPAPASLTATLTIDPQVPSPSSYSVAQVNAPAQPATLTTTVQTWIDATGGSGNVTQNTSESGFTAYGQTFSYQIFTYRNVGGARVVNPTYLAFSFTDPINDGTTTFGLDINGWLAPNSQSDGFIVWRNDTYSGQTYWVDIGNNTSYSDQGFTNQDAYVAASYADGSAYNSQLAAYTNINGTNYASAYELYSFSDSMYSGSYVVLNSTWSDAPNAMFQAQNGTWFDLGSATSYVDYGQNTGGISPYAAFSAIAFPYFNTGVVVPDTGANCSVNDGSGALIANNSAYYVQVYAYAYHPYTGVPYFVSGADTSPITYDDNSGSPCSISGSFTAGTNVSGYVVQLFQNGTLICGPDIGNTTSFSGLDGTQPIAPIVNFLSSYTGLTRDFSAYGQTGGPKYSSTHNDQTFTDNNPAAGYVISHLLSGFGTATGMKLIQQQLGSLAAGSFYYDVPITTPIIQTYTALGDATVTPNTLGYLANGANLTINYVAQAMQTISGTPVISPASPTASTIDPNDGNYYTVALASAQVAGSTYAFTRTGDQTGSINAGSAYDFSDTVAESWTYSLPTATSGKVTAGIFERAQGNSTDVPIATFRNLTGGSGFGSNTFRYDTTGGGDFADCGRYGVDESYNYFIQSTNGGLKIGALGATQSDQIGVSNQTVFNYRQNSGYSLGIRGSSLSYLMSVNCGGGAYGDNVIFGSNSFPFSLGATVGIAAKGDGALALVGISGGATNPVLSVLDSSSGSAYGGMTNAGLGFFAAPSSKNANVAIGVANSVRPQVLFDNSSSLPSVNGSLTCYNGYLFYQDYTGNQARMVVADSTANAGYYWRTNSNGYPTADNTIVYNGTEVQFFTQVEFKQTITLDSGKSIVFNTAQIKANGGIQIGSDATANSRVGFYGATPIVRITTSVASATFVANTSANIAYKESTYDGYTMSQIVKALRTIGILA